MLEEQIDLKGIPPEWITVPTGCNVRWNKDGTATVFADNIELIEQFKENLKSAKEPPKEQERKIKKVKVNFKLPMVIVDADEYEISLQDSIAKIVIKLEQNKENLKNITGMEVHTSGKGGGVKLVPDPHGIANYSNITIEFPFSDSQPLAIKQRCIEYLNRLIEVVRNQTHAYWIQKIHDRDMIGFDFILIDETGKEIEGMVMFAMESGFPIPILDQSQIMDKIKGYLKTEKSITLHENLYLDSINYFVNGDYNESVIIMNIVLEVFVAERLYQKLISKGTDNEIAKNKISNYFGKGLHKVMKNAFKDIEGRSLEDNTTLWEKFEQARKTRKHAIHPYTKKLLKKEAQDTIFNILEVMKWVVSP